MMLKGYRAFLHSQL